MAFEAILLFMAAGGGAPLINPHIDVQGVATIRAFSADETRSRNDNGFGKLRFGSGEDGAQIGELTLVVNAGLNDWAGLYLHAQHQPEFDHVVDLVEGYLYVEVPAADRWLVGFDGGAVFPGVSRENRGVGWANTYTLTNAASFTWIGEDIRPIGARAGVTYLGDTVSGSIKGGVFYGNDPAAAVLAFGGWALNDLETPLLSEVDLPDDTRFPDEIEPFQEFDNRFGYQVLAELDIGAIGGVSLYWYDNRGDIDASEPGRVVWDTRFFAASAEFSLPWRLSLLPSVMIGDTETPTRGTNYETASLLISRDFGLPGSLGPVRISARGDWFEQDDIRANAPNDLSEDGVAGTVAARWSFGRFHEFVAELVHVRAQRETGPGGAPSETRETLTQIEYRFAF